MTTKKACLTPLVILVTLTFCLSGCHTHKFNYENWEQYGYTVPEIPSFIQNLLDSAEWYPDTICVVDGKAFYFAYEDYSRTCVIYNEDEILLENPTLCCDSVSSDEKYKFIITMVDKQMEVDFKDKESLRSVARLDTLPSSFCRFRKDTITGVENRIMYSICVDFLRPEEPHAETVNTWLSKLAEEYTTYDNINGTKYLTYLQNSLTDEEDKYLLARRAAYRFFNKLLYELNVNENTGLFYRTVCLRAWQVTGKYITMLKYTHEYWNGPHGIFTEELVSYDPETRREIDWDYLFKPGTREQVLKVFFRTASHDPKFNRGDPAELSDNTTPFIPYDEKGPLGKVELTRPGLGENGLVFSFQPYQLGGFVDGVFHFTIPYNNLLPYLTDEAKHLLGLVD